MYVQAKTGLIAPEVQNELLLCFERRIIAEHYAANRIELSQLVLIWRAFKMHVLIYADLRKKPKKGP